MYISDMLTALDSRLEDSDRTQFPEGPRVTALQNAQLTLVGSSLDRKYFTALEVYTDGIEVQAGGHIPLSSFPNLALDAKGIRGVRVYRNGVVDLWAREMDLNDKEAQRNSFKMATTLDPRWMAGNDGIYVMPSNIATVAVLRYRLPVPLIATIAHTTNGATDSFIAVSLIGSDLDYTGGVIYSTQTAKYHVVTGYNDTTGVVTVTPSHTGNFTTSTFYFITDDFRVLGLSGVAPEINEALHPLMVTAACVELWESSNNMARMNAAQERMGMEIAMMVGIKK